MTCPSSQEKLKQKGSFLTPVNKSVQLILEFMNICMLRVAGIWSQKVDRKIEQRTIATCYLNIRQNLNIYEKNPRKYGNL